MNTTITPTGTAYRICVQPYFVTPGSCFYDYAYSSKDITRVVPTLQTGPTNYAGAQGLRTPLAVSVFTVNPVPAGWTMDWDAFGAAVMLAGDKTTDQFAGLDVTMLPLPGIRLSITRAYHR
jgi:hypothetical protein